jgi:hypothetical protein
MGGRIELGFEMWALKLDLMGVGSQFEEGTER